MADPSLYWENLYGEVVWAKVEQFEWWPCYVFDPELIVDKPYYAEKGKNFYRKKYTLMFYNDQTWGWTTPNLIQPFNEENTQKYKNQKVQNGYVTSFKAAIKEAYDDALRTKEDRLAWYFSKHGILNREHSPESDSKGLRNKYKKSSTSSEVSDNGIILTEKY